MTQTYDISVLIVNYNTADLISACIDSLKEQKNCRFEIIIVDNASQDDSLVKINTLLCDDTRLISSKENLGFGRAINLAAQSASGKYFYILNPDTRIKDTLVLKKLYDFMEKTPKIGITGMPLLDANGKNESPAKTLYPDEQYIEHKLPPLPGDIAWVVGAALFIRRDLFEKMNGFDKDFFLYGEEVDLCLRIRKAGFTVAYCNTTPVYHLGGGSERAETAFNTNLRKIRGLILFCQKHYHPDDVEHLLQRYKGRAQRKVIKNKLLFFLTRHEKFKVRAEHNRAIIAAAEECLNHNR